MIWKKDVYSLPHAKPERKNLGAGLPGGVFCKMLSICMAVRWSGRAAEGTDALGRLRAV